MKQVGMLRKYWRDVDKPVSKDQIFAILENYLYFHDDTKSIFLWKEENIYKTVAFTKISQMATYLKSPASFAAEKLFLQTQLDSSLHFPSAYTSIVVLQTANGYERLLQLILFSVMHRALD